jgi:hypothetical protein
LQFCKTHFETLPLFSAFAQGYCAPNQQEDTMKEIGHWIDGKLVAGTSGRFADVMNPATGEVQARVALASKADRKSSMREK